MRSEYHGIPPRTLLRLTPVAVLTLSDIRRISLVGLGYSDRIITAARRMIFRAIAFGRDRRGDVLFRLRDYGLQGLVEPGIGASKISCRQSWLTCRWLGQFGQSVQFIRRVEGRAAVDSGAESMRSPREAA